MQRAKLGIIGGTGLYQIEGLTNVNTLEIDTPFGPPSDVITTGNLDDIAIAFLPRHGKGHRITPTELPSRANIYALKMMGVEYIISVNAVGSLNEDMHPGDILIPDQFIDKTMLRPNTFFGEGLVAHIAFAEPVCASLSKLLYDSAVDAGARAHLGGTYVVMEGPAFSTKAESKLHRSWGADVIGMTALPEAKLAREAEICYGSISCVTDYDSWHETEETVSVDLILSVLHRNVIISKEIIKRAASNLPGRHTCGCSNALKNTIVTDLAVMSSERIEKIKHIVGRYFNI